jgi:hypothetical protein
LREVNPWTEDVTPDYTVTDIVRKLSPAVNWLDSNIGQPMRAVEQAVWHPISQYLDDTSSADYSRYSECTEDDPLACLQDLKNQEANSNIPPPSSTNSNTNATTEFVPADSSKTSSDSSNTQSTSESKPLPEGGVISETITAGPTKIKFNPENSDNPDNTKNFKAENGQNSEESPNTASSSGDSSSKTFSSSSSQDFHTLATTFQKATENVSKDNPIESVLEKHPELSGPVAAWQEIKQDDNFRPAWGPDNRERLGLATDDIRERIAGGQLRFDGDEIGIIKSAATQRHLENDMGR